MQFGESDVVCVVQCNANVLFYLFKTCSVVQYSSLCPRTGSLYPSHLTPATPPSDLTKLSLACFITMVKSVQNVLLAVVMTASMLILFHSSFDATIKDKDVPHEEPLCRQHGYCGMTDMQLAYEGHYFGLQQCYAWGGRGQSEVPSHVSYESLDEKYFAPLLAAYETLEDLLQECLGEMEDVNQMERVFKVLHYPLPPMQVPKHLGEYTRYLSGPKAPGRANKFVHTTAKTTCIGGYHNHISSWRDIDPDQQVVYWTDDALNRFVDRLFKYSKFSIFMRRVRHVNGNHQGVMIADLFRTLLMLVFGGIYADTDILVSRPWEHIFDMYDVLAAHEEVTPEMNQWKHENWRPGMRTIYGGSFIMMADKPGLSYWVNYLNQAIDELNRKTNTELGACHPVQCSGPKVTSDRHYEFMASYPANETKRAAILDVSKEFFDITGMKHRGHCSWCGLSKEPTFDIRAAMPSPALLFPPGTLSERECPYEAGLKAIYDPHVGMEAWGKPAVMEMDEELKNSNSQHPMFKLSGRIPITEAPAPAPVEAPVEEPQPEAQPEQKPEEREATPPADTTHEMEGADKAPPLPPTPVDEASPPAPVDTDHEKAVVPEQEATPPAEPAQEKEATPPSEPAHEMKPEPPLPSTPVDEASPPAPVDTDHEKAVVPEQEATPPEPAQDAESTPPLPPTPAGDPAPMPVEPPVEHVPSA